MTVTGRSSNPVITRPSLASIQISPNPILRAEVLLSFRYPLQLATYDMRTLMYLRKQAPVALTLETLSIDVCYAQETSIQDSISIILLIFPPSPSLKFHLRFSEAAAFNLPGFGVTLSERTEFALVDLDLADSWLCAEKLGGS